MLQSFLFDCPPGLLFNSLDKKCDWADLVFCNQKKKTTSICSSLHLTKQQWTLCQRKVWSNSGTIAEITIDRDELIELATLAEKAERYKDMAVSMKTVAKSGLELSNKERHLLNTAYKNMVGSRKNASKIIASNDPHHNEPGYGLAKEYVMKIEKELHEISTDILSLLNDILIPKTTDTKPKIFYLKMKGDFNRYIAEVTRREEQKAAIANISEKAYKEAFNLSKSTLDPANPLRLGIALSLSNLYYDIMSKSDSACSIAKQAFTDGQHLNISKENYMHSAFILQRLRDKMTGDWNCN